MGYPYITLTQQAERYRHGIGLALARLWFAFGALLVAVLLGLAATGTGDPWPLIGFAALLALAWFLAYRLAVWIIRPLLRRGWDWR